MLRSRTQARILDHISRFLFCLSAVIAALMLILILVFVTQKGIQVFLPSTPYQQSLSHFFTGFRWRSDQADYGVAFIVINTLITVVLAAVLAFPISVLSALMISKIAMKPIRIVMSTVVELLAAIPSVVFGVFASGQITKWVSFWAGLFNYTTFGGNSMLAVILLLAVMIYPTMTAISIVAIDAVPKTLEQASLALGASQTQTRFKVVLPAARSGIFAGLLMGIGRAIGEATAVSMVAGNAFTGPSWNPFDITRTLTSTMLSGMHEAVGLDYDIRFTVGIVLMLLAFGMNFVIRKMKKTLSLGV